MNGLESNEGLTPLPTLMKQLGDVTAQIQAHFTQAGVSKDITFLKANRGLTSKDGDKFDEYMETVGRVKDKMPFGFKMSTLFEAWDAEAKSANFGK